MVCFGLKKSKTPAVAMPVSFENAIILGFAVISIAIAPAPWVYSPDEFKSYLALSVAITIAFFVGCNRTKSTQFWSASTAPMQANVKSTTSQFCNEWAPYFSSIS